MESALNLRLHYLLLASAVIVHAMLCGHGGGGVQCGSIERHPLHVSNVAGEVGQAGAVRLVGVPPVLKELLKQWGLSTLWENGNLKGEKGKNMARLPSKGLREPRVPIQSPRRMADSSLPYPHGICLSLASDPYLGLSGILHLGDEVRGCFEGSLPLFRVGLLACQKPRERCQVTAVLV